MAIPDNVTGPGWFQMAAPEPDMADVKLALRYLATRLPANDGGPTTH